MGLDQFGTNGQIDEALKPCDLFKVSFYSMPTQETGSSWRCMMYDWVSLYVHTPDQVTAGDGSEVLICNPVCSLAECWHMHDSAMQFGNCSNQRE